jgi:hypothetical protein
MDNKCSFCCGSNHTIRFCDSPLIIILQQNMAYYYYNALQQSVELGLNDQDTKAFFVSYIIERCTFRELRVLSVTSTEAATSGINKEQYAHILYAYYKEVLNSIVNQVRNLATDFDAVANNLVKKFDIIPYLNNEVNPEVNPEVNNCCICMCDDVKISDLVKLNCCHQFCGECITKTLEKHSSDIKPVSCALCRATVTRIDVNSSDCFNVISKFCNF